MKTLSSITINVDDDTTVKSSPVVPTPRTSHTWGKKQWEDAFLEDALKSSKRKRVTTSASLSPYDSSADILLRSQRKKR